MLQRLTAGMMLLVVLAVAGVAAAKDDGPGTGAVVLPEHGRGIVRMLEKLDLTTAQKQQVARLLKDNQPQAEVLRASMREALTHLGDVMDKTPEDAAAVRQAAEGVAKAGVELAVQRARIKAGINAVLTPEQKAKQAAFRADFKDKVKERLEKQRNILDEWINKNLPS